MSDAFVRPLTTPSRSSLETEAALARSADFMEALVAACAMMAHADGEMATAERRRIMALVRENPLLSIVSRADIRTEIDTHEANYRLDPELAHLLAAEKLMKIADIRRLGHRVIEACRAVLPADGIAHPSEYRVLAEIRAMLNLDEARSDVNPAVQMLYGSPLRWVVIWSSSSCR